MAAKCRLICCGILREEIKAVLSSLETTAELEFLPPGLHVDLKKLENHLVTKLAVPCEKPRILVYGSECHPSMPDWEKEYQVVRLTEPDCIGLVLGRERRLELSREARTFYLTPGWLAHWREIFVAGLGWDSSEARRNFGFYERVLLLDTGVLPVSEEALLEFFDYVQVSIEILPVTLDNLRRELALALTKASC